MISLGGGETTPLFFVLKSSAKTLLVHKTCLYSGRLHCLYICQGGWCLYSQSLKKALSVGTVDKHRVDKQQSKDLNLIWQLINITKLITSGEKGITTSKSPSKPLAYTLRSRSFSYRLYITKIIEGSKCRIFGLQRARRSLGRCI